MTQTTLGDASAGPKRAFYDADWCGEFLAFLGWTGRRFLFLWFISHLWASWLLALGTSWHFGAREFLRFKSAHFSGDIFLLLSGKNPILTCFVASDNGPSIVIGDTVPEYIIDPSDPIQVALSHVTLISPFSLGLLLGDTPILYFYFLLVSSSLGPRIHMTLHSWRTILCPERR